MSYLYTASRFHVGRRSERRRRLWMAYRTAPGVVFVRFMALALVGTGAVLGILSTLRFFR